MTSSARIPLLLACASALAGCATGPTVAPKPVAVAAETLSPKYSSFNARVLGEAGTVDQTFVASLDPSDETLTRLDSTYTQNLGEDRETLRVGDAVSSVGMWGSSVRYGGMQFGTRSQTRADVITSTRLATTGLAVLPTVADALFASAGSSGTSLSEQKLTVDRSLRGSGPGAWSLVAEDALGNSESITAPMIAGTRLSESGCSDFSVGFGRARRDYALTSNDYGPLFANSTVTCGAPLGFTVEGHGEYLADEVAAIGVGVARQLGPLGTASVAVAQSHAEAGSGWLARFGYEYQNPTFNVMLRSRMQSREFREIGAVSLDDTIMQRDLASVGVNVAAGSNLSLAYATQMTWAQQRTNLVALKQSLNVGRGALSMSAGQSLREDFGPSLFLSYKRPFGERRPTRSVVEEFDLDLLNSTLAP